MKWRDGASKRINNLLLESVKLERALIDHKLYKAASMARQMISQRVLEVLPLFEARGKVICRCGRWVRTGKEIEFYKNVCSCYSCDSSYIDEMEEKIYDQ